MPAYPNALIQATPRNAMLGRLSDALASTYSPERTQQAQQLAQFLSVPAISRTLDRLSYGEPLTTGAGGLGGTTRFNNDALEAAMAIAPMVGPAAKLAGKGAMATGRFVAPKAGQLAEGYMQRIGSMPGIMPSSTFDNSALMAGKAIAKIDQITGLPLNADGTVTLFHHTNKNAAQSIQKTGVLKSAGEPSVYLTTERTPTTGYGDTVVPVKVNPSKLNLDDEFPNGRLDFSIDVGKPGGSIKVALVPSFVAPQDEALRLAQQRASLPPAQGGLGLPAGNTPEQRAAGMGFDVNNTLYHATDAPQDFSSIIPSVRGKLGAGVYTSPSAKYAEKYAGDNARIMPLVSRGNFINEDARIALQDAMHEKMFAQDPNLSVQDWRKATNQAISDAGYAGSDIASERVVTNPENLRSRFAAFDPFRRTAAIAAAAGLAAPDLLAGQSLQQAPKFDNSALMK
jgi:hypothetical protein